MSEKLCLQWNDFKDNVKVAFANFREDKDFSDVTLACEDGEQVEAHKLVLAASSPFFQNLFKRNKHPHPLVYMRGLKSDDLLAILDFLYNGEANVNQDNLDSFLALAEELQLKGLRSQVEKEEEAPQGKYKTEITPAVNPNFGKTKRKTNNLHPETNLENRSLALPNLLSGDIQELDNQVQSMMEKGTNLVTCGKDKNGKETLRTAFVCKVCLKEGQMVNIRNHIEANHLEGISIPCSLCQNLFRSRKALGKHKVAYHK